MLYMRCVLKRKLDCRSCDCLKCESDKNVKTISCCGVSVAGKKGALDHRAAKKLQQAKKCKVKPYIQNSACLKLRPVLRCRECRSKTAQHSTNEHQCRFFSFRRYV